MQTITWKGRLGPMDLTASDTTFLPSTISQLMAAVLDVKPGDVVIDVGCGTGVLGMIAAKLGASKVYGVDASPDVVEVATANARAHGVADRMEFFQGDLFSPLGDDVTADVIIGDVSGIPDDLAADSGWFPSKTGGGPRVRAAHPHAAAGQAAPRRGRTAVPPDRDAAGRERHPRRARSAFSSLVKLTERPIPLAGALADAKSIKRLLDDGIVQLSERGSRLLWEARVWLCAATPGLTTPARQTPEPAGRRPASRVSAHSRPRSSRAPLREEARPASVGWRSRRSRAGVESGFERL